MQDAGAPNLIVVVVHGTFPRGMGAQVVRGLRATWARLRRRVPDEASLWSSRTAWFQDGSDFVKAITAPLDRTRVDVETFYWSGRNTFAERESARLALRAFLTRLAARCPGTPQVLVAHSHGGTVACDAVGDPFVDPPDEVVQIITMGTPFIRLTTWAADRVTATRRIEAGVRHVYAFVLPVATLSAWLIVPVATLVFSPPPARAVSACLLLAGLWFAVGVRAGAALLLLPVLLFLTRAFVSLYPVELGVVIALASGLTLYAASDAINARVNTVLRDRALRLPCPLLALRAPRDEASLAIGAGQLVQAVLHLLGRMSGVKEKAKAAIVPPRRRLPVALDHAIWTATSVIAGFIVGSLVLTTVGWWTGTPRLPLMGVTGGEWFLHAVARAFLGLGLLMAVPTVLTTLAWAVAVDLLTLVAGPEVALRPAMTYVDMEPLPDARGYDGQRDADMRLEILYGALSGGLNHSMYDDEGTRRRIATALRGLAARRHDPAHRLSYPQRQARAASLDGVN